MVSKKDKNELTNAISQLAKSSERLEDTTYFLLVVTIFLFAISFVAASAGYNYSGGAYNFLLTLIIGVLIAIFITFMLVKSRQRNSV